MPRIFIRRENHEEFRVDVRYRTDFDDVFASVLGEDPFALHTTALLKRSKETGTSYKIPQRDWVFVSALCTRLPFGLCDFFHSASIQSLCATGQITDCIPACKLQENCQLRLLRATVCDDSAPIGYPGDERWMDLMDVSGGFRSIANRLRRSGDIDDEEFQR